METLHDPLLTDYRTASLLAGGTEAVLREQVFIPAFLKLRSEYEAIVQ